MSHIACPTCSKDDAVQKITAIVGGETVTTSGHSSTSGSSNVIGTQNMYAADGSYVGQGKISSQGSSGSSTYTNSTQKSNLASRLQPPSKPSQPDEPHYGKILYSHHRKLLEYIFNVTFFGFYAVVCCALMLIGGLIGSGTGLFLGFFGGMVVGTGMLSLADKKILPDYIKPVNDFLEKIFDKRGAFDAAKQDYFKRQDNYNERMQHYNDVAYPTWKLKTEHWNQAFYCRRCDNVYVPGNKKVAPPSNMEAIL